MRHTILIILIISILYLPGFASAQVKVELEPDWINKLYQKIDQEIINPVKQTIQNLPQDIERGFKNFLEKVQQKKQEKQEEIKQEIKSEVKKETKQWGQKGEEKIKEWLTPLKNKIQQGTGLVRQVINKVKDFLINFFKE